jgi:hypothetical protein
MRNGIGEACRSENSLSRPLPTLVYTRKERKPARTASGECPPPPHLPRLGMNRTWIILYWFSCASDSVVSAKPALSPPRIPGRQACSSDRPETAPDPAPMMLNVQPGIQQRAAAQRLRGPYHQMNESFNGCINTPMAQVRELKFGALDGSLASGTSPKSCQAAN